MQHEVIYENLARDYITSELGASVYNLDTKVGPEMDTLGDQGEPKVLQMSSRNMIIMILIFGAFRADIS